MTDAMTAPSAQTRDAQHAQHGGFIWYELLTTDPDAATDFYGKVVGWKARDAGMGGDMIYTLLSAGGTDIGGLMKLPDDNMKPGWLGYIGVDDVDAAAEKLKAAGGAIHMGPQDIPNVGRFAMVADPQGVSFYVMRGNKDEKSEAFKPLADGHGAWNELVTIDQAAALDFYIDQFGWEKGDAMPMGEAGDYRFINHHGEMIGAVMNRMDNSNSTTGDQPPKWNYYFRVPDIANAVDAIKDNGGTITFGPEEVPGDLLVINAIDPQNAAFGLVAPKK